MSWNEWLEVLFCTNGSDTGTTTSMRNGKGLMEIQVSNVGPDQAWRCESHLGVQVGTVEVNLTAN